MRAPRITWTVATDGTPDAVIAIDTLAAAAASGPVRRRVQARVDHRFNRARYDALTVHPTRVLLRLPAGGWT